MREGASSRAHARLLLAARICGVIAGLFAGLALLGYAINLPLLIHVRTGLEGMSPITATALLALSVAVEASAFRRRKLAAGGAAIAIFAGGATLVARLVAGADTASLWLGTAVFHMQAGGVGRTSIATALCILLVSAALLLRRKAVIADLAAGAGLAVSGMALLGYLYGVGDLYALPMFNSMALNTAAALLLLTMAVFLVEPATGLAAVIGSVEPGGRATRRQLSFIALPIVAGKLLLWATAAAGLGPAVAMALLVIVTVLPLAILILRDGQVLNTLDGERRDKARMQELLAAEMTDRLAHQAAELARESDERAKAEVAMHRAQRMEAVGQLTGGIAHDFNNLLMAIRGNLQLMQGRLPVGDDRLRRYVENAVAATDKGAKVTAQLLAFSRSQRLDIRVVELDPVLKSARELIGNALGPDIALEMRLESEGASVRTDPDQLELAILNLAVNARDAMPDGGRICIESAPSEGGEAEAASYAAIRVIDDGSGMTAEVAAQAIEPFFTTKERGKGTGLGLAQVYGFARQCGGDLRIASSPGVGTTVEILMPRAAPTVAAAAARPELVPHSAWPLSAAGRQVLVIDDDDAVRAVIVDALVNAGFDVIQAADGERGLALLESSTPAAAVIDFLMPGMNGAEVAKIAQERRPGLPIIFVSGYSDTVALDGIAGAVVLRKPFDVDGLSRALTSVLN